MTERMMPLPNWRRTPILNEYLLPVDAPHFMPAWLHKSGTKFVTLSLLGSKKRGPFDTQDVEIFQRILPHVSRALEIRDRLERAKVRTETIAQQLDTVTFGVAVLDTAGKVLDANSVMQNYFGCDRAIRREADGTLSLCEPAGTQLRRWIGSCMPPEDCRDGLLRVPRLDALPLSVLLTPLPTRTCSCAEFPLIGPTQFPRLGTT
jgi:PAS domain-containing protein